MGGASTTFGLSFDRFGGRPTFLQPAEVCICPCRNQILGTYSVVSGDSLAPDSDKMIVVKNSVAPTYICSRGKTIPGFFQLLSTLYQVPFSHQQALRRAGKTQTLRMVQKYAFETLQHVLRSAPELKIADVDKPFQVVTDTSDSALGAVLLQMDEGRNWHPVVYICELKFKTRGAKVLYE